jgi:hypothetical protein
MNDVQTKLECLRLAAGLCDGPAALRLAREFYEFAKADQ